MLVDLHLHTTRYSTGCSLLEPRSMLRRLLELGLDGAAITEHDYLWSRSETERLKALSPERDFFLVSGKEVDSDQGHLLVFGYSGPIDPVCSADDVVQAARQNGGAVVWAHPLRYGRFDNASDEEIAALARKCDAFEALTPSHSPAENQRALALAEKYGLTATGGSDGHTLADVGRVVTRFDRRLTGLEDLIAAIKDGACAPQPGPGF